ncbi:unnamed protein product [Prorocentrum cordatum]|uniref:Protein xylosyltransferase n=1 Tax=Prorocentrum cordatum TaxID=2364126 RepID=A0ABN9XPB1_9DINO|nr:unnamed protein product [Polarella glacialis]
MSTSTRRNFDRFDGQLNLGVKQNRVVDLVLEACLPRKGAPMPSPRRAPLAVAAALCGARAAAALGVRDLPGTEAGGAAAGGAGARAADGGPCDGCEFTIDLRCEGIRSSRSAPFHRITDCLLPLYGLIDLARNASVHDGKRVCAVTWLDAWEGLNLNPFLVDLTGVQWHSIINEREACGKRLPYHAINRTYQSMATHDYLNTFGSDPLMVKSYHINYGGNLRVLQADVSRVVNHDEQLPSIVVLQRNTGTRRFRPVALLEIIDRLGPVGLPVEQYTGREKAMDTIRLFSSAKGVLGYHGAAWANLYFSSETTCNVQVSTFYDLESTKPWRTAMESGIRNPRALWFFYLLPLNMLLDANHVHHDAYLARQEKDHFIKDLDWVPLRDVDIAEITDNMVQCLLDPAAYEKGHEDHASKQWTHGWEPAQAASREPMSGRLTSTGRDPCSGCDVTVDLRCEGYKKSRGTYYGSVANCLLPAYEMLQVAREAASNSSAQVCAMTWREGQTLRPFLESVSGIRWHKILDESDACTGGLKYHAIQPPAEQADLLRQASAEGSRMLHRYPVDLKQNLVWLHKDTVNLAGKPSPHIIILQNQRLRVFPQRTMDVFQEKLAQFMQQRISVYSGEGTVTDAVKLFTNAGSVIGFWGDLWVNTLFTYTPHCTIEISTYEDLDKQKPWRTSAEIKKLNPAGDWYFLHVSPRPLLQGNGISEKTFSSTSNKDVLLQNMKLASIPDQDDAVDVASRVFLCWQNKERAYSFTTESWSWHGHA